MASGVHTQIKQEHTTLHRSVVCIRIRDHRQLLAAACHNLLKRHGSPTSTYNWNTPNIYIYTCMYGCLFREQFSKFVRTLNSILLWLTNDKRRSSAWDKKSAVDKEPLSSWWITHAVINFLICANARVSSRQFQWKVPLRVVNVLVSSWREARRADTSEERRVLINSSPSLSKEKKGEKGKGGRIGEEDEAREKDRRILWFVGLNQVSSARIGCNKVCTYRVHALGTRYVASSRWTWGTQRTGTSGTRPYTC